MKKNKLKLKLIILLIVSAAFVLSRFGTVNAEELSSDTITAQEEAAAVEATDSTIVTASSNQEKSPVETFGGDGGDSLLMPMLKLIGALILVVAAIYGFLFLLKKMMGQNYSGAGGRMIEVIESSNVAPKKSVALVRYTDRAVLIGIADNAISVLAELSPEETQKIIKESAPSRKQAGFKGMLDAARGRLDNLGFQGFKAVINPSKKENTQAA